MKKIRSESKMKGRMKDAQCAVCLKRGNECCLSATCGSRMVCLSCHLASQTGERYPSARVWRPVERVTDAPLVTADEARAESFFAGISD